MPRDALLRAAAAGSRWALGRGNRRECGVAADDGVRRGWRGENAV